MARPLTRDEADKLKSQVEAQKALLRELRSGTITVDAPGVMGVIESIAACGISFHDWNLLCPLLSARVDQVARDFNRRTPDCPNRPGETFADKRVQLQDAVRAFDAAPFTLQRLCEVLVDPARQYPHSTYKMLASIDKLLSVTSTVQHTNVTEYVKAGLQAARSVAARSAAGETARTLDSARSGGGAGSDAGGGKEAGDAAPSAGAAASGADAGGSEPLSGASEGKGGGGGGASGSDVAEAKDAEASGAASSEASLKRAGEVGPGGAGGGGDAAMGGSR